MLEKKFDVDLSRFTEEFVFCHFKCLKNVLKKITRDKDTFEESSDVKGLFKTAPFKKRLVQLHSASTMEKRKKIGSCFLNELSAKSSKREMYKPVKKIATTFARPAEWTVFPPFGTDEIYVPVDKCQTQTTLSSVNEKVSVQETVTVKKKLAPVKNDLSPVKVENIDIKVENIDIKIENGVQIKTYRPRKTFRYSKKNMTPEQIEDYYCAREAQVQERFNLRSRVPRPCSQMNSHTAVKTEAIPSGPSRCEQDRDYRMNVVKHLPAKRLKQMFCGIHCMWVSVVVQQDTNTEHPTSLVLNSLSQLHYRCAVTFTVSSLVNEQNRFPVPENRAHFLCGLSV
ncbi:uncharacterized protein TNIN_160411 [Trichonephila inaurata madagascariensis]|uniref:Uncharacterized protein n=1 Tax=Trichonephila inaurata madagascariensis TaxID=2747483 RepID=A0A8X6Y283_9ARAC|nr:uncharacterized protein TNIN_160411 [Trichonephila inaurata madagascariensis]